jgi:hypothetical protein
MFRWPIVVALALVGVPVLAYLLALAVNWRDEPPSEEARELAGAPLPPPVEDAENAYVYLLGFAAPLTDDPAEAGARRAGQLRAPESAAAAASTPDRAGAFDLQHIPPALQAVLGPCSNSADAACVSALDAAQGNLREELQQQKPLIERYAALLRFKRWQEVANPDASGPPPPYIQVRYARQLFLLETWLLAVAGDAGEVRARLEADLAFSRLALADADSLLAKAIAGNFCADNFEWGNLLLHRLPPERRADGAPEGWRKALTAPERSMRRALGGEWRLFAASLARLKAVGFGGAATPGRQRSLGDRFSNALWLPMLQPQASANRHAALFVKVDSLLSTPYAGLPAAVARAPEANTPDKGIVANVYNFVGDGLAWADPAALAAAGARIANLEGVRRAALVTADLRALKIPAELAGAMVPLAAVRDPFTGGPFGWSPSPPAVTFTGLADRAYTFLY